MTWETSLCCFFQSEFTVKPHSTWTQEDCFKCIHFSSEDLCEKKHFFIPRYFDLSYDHYLLCWWKQNKKITNIDNDTYIYNIDTINIFCDIMKMCSKKTSHLLLVPGLHQLLLLRGSHDLRLTGRGGSQESPRWGRGAGPQLGAIRWRLPSW